MPRASRTDGAVGSRAPGRQPTLARGTRIADFLAGGDAIYLHAEKKNPSFVPCTKYSWGPAFLTGNEPLWMSGTEVC